MIHKQRLDDYIQQVCNQIRNKEMHASISQELQGHLEEKIEEYQSTGLTEEDAIDKAIADMGDPIQVGKHLHQAHKPRMEWSVIALVAVLIGFGLLVMYSLSQSQTDAGHLFTNKVVGILLGLGLFIALLFFDYRKLQPYSLYLYLGIVLCMLLTLPFGTTVNGRPMYLNLGFLFVNVYGMCSVLLILSMAGMFAAWNWEKRKTLLWAALVFLVPFIFLIASNHAFEAFLILAGFLVLMAASPAPRRSVLELFGVLFVAITGVAFLMIKQYQLHRILSFLDPHADPNGTGYTLLQSLKALQEAGLWGHGFGASLNTLPGTEAELVFAYIVHSFGLVTGAAILLLGIILLVRLLRAVRLVRDRYGVMLMSGFMTLFFIPYFWSILMTAGFLPIMSANLPFISYGNTSFLMQMLLIGLVLNVYRRKDMQPIEACKPPVQN